MKRYAYWIVLLFMMAILYFVMFSELPSPP
jgi:hypothetical protein